MAVAFGRIIYFTEKDLFLHAVNLAVDQREVKIFFLLSHSVVLLPHYTAAALERKISGSRFAGMTFCDCWRTSSMDKFPSIICQREMEHEMRKKKDEMRKKKDEMRKKNAWHSTVSFSTQSTDHDRGWYREFPVAEPLFVSIVELSEVILDGGRKASEFQRNGRKTAAPTKNIPLHNGKMQKKLEIHKHQSSNLVLWLYCFKSAKKSIFLLTEKN